MKRICIKEIYRDMAAFDGKTITVYDQTAVVLSDGVLGGGFFDYKKLAKKLDCTIDVKTYQDNVQFTKILAGDSDIDIYVINSDEAELLSNALISLLNTL